MGWIEGNEEEEAWLMRRIAASPGDSGPRQTYADWLEQRGERELASLIRLGDSGEVGSKAATTMQLLQSGQRRWSRPLQALGAEECEFRGGLPVKVTLVPGEFRLQGSKLLAMFPTIREARIHWLPAHGSIAASDIASCPHLSHLSVLTLSHNGVGPAGAEALSCSGYASNLKTLDLYDNALGDCGAGALDIGSALANLTSLDLGRNGIGPDGVKKLAQSGCLKALIALNLAENPLGRDGLRELAQSSAFTSLERLEIDEPQPFAEELAHARWNAALANGPVPLPKLLSINGVSISQFPQFVRQGRLIDDEGDAPSGHER